MCGRLILRNILLSYKRKKFYESNLHKHKKNEYEDKLGQLEMILVQGLRAECLLCWLLPPEAVLLEHHLPEAVEHRVLAAPLAVRAGSAEASSLADCKHFFLITNVPFNVFGILSQYVHAHCLDFKSHKLFLEICMYAYPIFEYLSVSSSKLFYTYP